MKVCLYGLSLFSRGGVDASPRGRIPESPPATAAALALPGRGGGVGDDSESTG